MNKQDFVNELSKTAGITRTDAATAVDAFCATVTAALKRGEKVTLTGFGIFETRVRDERDARNPQTGETVRVAAHKAVAFRPGAGLKEAVR